MVNTLGQLIALRLAYNLNGIYSFFPGSCAPTDLIDGHRPVSEIRYPEGKTFLGYTSANNVPNAHMRIEPHSLAAACEPKCHDNCPDGTNSCKPCSNYASDLNRLIDREAQIYGRYVEHHHRRY